MKLLEAVADSQSQVTKLARQQRPQTAPSGRRRPGTAGGKPGTAGAAEEGGVAPPLKDTSMRRGTYFGFSTGKAEMLHKRNPPDGTIFSKTAGEVEAAGFAAQLDEAAEAPETATTPKRPGSSNTSHRRGTFFGATHSAAGERSQADLLKSRQARKTKAEIASREERVKASKRKGPGMLPSIDGGDSVDAMGSDGFGSFDLGADGAPPVTKRPSGGRAGGQSKRSTFFGFDDGKALSRKTKRTRARKARKARERAMQRAAKLDAKAKGEAPPAASNAAAAAAAAAATGAKNADANGSGESDEENLQRSPAAMVSAQAMGKRGSFFGLLRGVSGVGADDEEIDEAAIAVGSLPPSTGSTAGASVSKHTRRLSGAEIFEQGLMGDIMAEAGMTAADGAAAGGAAPVGAPMVKFSKPENDEKSVENSVDLDAPWTGDEGLEEARPRAASDEVSLEGSHHVGGDEDHDIDMGADEGSLEWKLWQMALAAPKITAVEALNVFDDLDSEGHAGKQEVGQRSTA